MPIVFKMEIIEEIKIPEKMECKIEDGTLTIKGANGITKRKFAHPMIRLKVEKDHISISSPRYSKREKRMIGTFKAHIKNMLKGELKTYTLKVCSGHFPMSIKIEKNIFKINNFLGEKIPRMVNLREGVDVKLDGDHIIIKSIDKELAGQTAADIENLTKRPGFDQRIFQDGIYIVSKPLREI